MSSHHIIRDEQEPPVLVFQINNNWQELSEILGWSPILLINPILKEAFELRQTKIDGYLSEESNSTDAGEKDLVYKDSEFVESMLSWVDTKNCTALNIFCNDDFMMDLFLQLKSKLLLIPIIFFTENGKYILKPNSKFKKWYPEKFRLNILNEDIISIQNLKQDSGEYSVEKEGFVIIEVAGNLVLIKERHSMAITLQFQHQIRN